MLGVDEDTENSSKELHKPPIQESEVEPNRPSLFPFVGFTAGKLENLKDTFAINSPANRSAVFLQRPRNRPHFYLRWNSTLFSGHMRVPSIIYEAGLIQRFHRLTRLCIRGCAREHNKSWWIWPRNARDTIRNRSNVLGKRLQFLSDVACLLCMHLIDDPAMTAVATLPSTLNPWHLEN